MFNDNNTIYAEADSQEEAVEQLMQDLDEENGSWSPIFPTEPEIEEYDPWLPQFEMPNHEEILASIPFDTIGRYIGQTARRNVAERDIARQEVANLQADFVEEVSQRLEIERKASFQQRQIAIFEKQNLEDRRRIIELEEQEDRQKDLVSIIEARHQQELTQKDERVKFLEEEVKG